VSRAASRVLDPDALIRITLDETIRILNADRAFLFLSVGGSVTTVEDVGTGERLVPHLGRDAARHDVTELTGYSASLVERVWVEHELLVMTGTDEGEANGTESGVRHGLRSIMAAPLQLEGRMLGVIYLDSHVAKGIFTADDAGILTALTTHIATSLETARAAQLEVSVQTAHQQRYLAEQLRDSLELMSGTFDPDQVLLYLLDATPRLVKCDGAWLFLDRGAVLTVIDRAGGAVTDRTLPADSGFTELLTAGAPVVGGQGTAVPGVFADLLTGVASWIALPLVARTVGLGVMLLTSSTPRAFQEAQTEVAAAVVAQAMTAHDNSSLFARLRQLAVVDELTGVANRRRFFEVADRDVATARRSDRSLMALMVDIDHFKRVNDTYGHPTGDDVIRAVASRLADGIRATDTLGRYGGEEFALMLLDSETDSGLPERLRQAVADTPIETRSGPVRVTVSIGLSCLSPEDATIDALLARADRALYEAKAGGRNRVQSA
jgi:diguanylate cyclase (GGDEF)-like protein